MKNILNHLNVLSEQIKFKQKNLYAITQIVSFSSNSLLNILVIPIVLLRNILSIDLSIYFGDSFSKSMCIIVI